MTRIPLTVITVQKRIVRRIIRKGVLKLKISAAWMLRHHNCTLEGILLKCGGKCCSNPGYWPPSAYAGPDNPNNNCGNLGPNGCMLSPEDKPIKCHLYPLILNKNRTLVVHYRSQVKTSCCKGNAGEGPMIIDVLRESLITLFGLEEYTRIRISVLDGKDTYINTPANIANQLKLEEQWEELNTRPIPRSRI